MLVRYSDDQKRVIKANAMNRQNCKHLPELVRIAEQELRIAERSLHLSNPKLERERVARISEARDKYEDRKYKLEIYAELFPDLFTIKKPGI